MHHYKIDYQVSIFRKKDKEVLTRLSGDFEFLTNKDGSVDPEQNEKIKQLIMQQINTPVSPYAALWEAGVISFEVTDIKIKELQSVLSMPSDTSEPSITCLNDVLWGILEIRSEIVDPVIVRRIRHALENNERFKAVLFESEVQGRTEFIGFAIFEEKNDAWMLHGGFDEYDTWTEESHAYLYSSYWRHAANLVGVDINKVISSDICYNPREVRYAIDRQKEPIVMMQGTRCYAF